MAHDRPDDSGSAAPATAEAASRPRPSPWLRLTVLAASIVAALGLAEVLLRVTNVGVYALRVNDYPFVKAPGAAYYEFDPARPPSHVWDGDPYGRLPDGARMTYEIGQHGLRGAPPARGRPTVLVLGDSFTFGEGVRLEDTFTARLERAFAARAGAPAFVNAGVPGYGTVEEAARLPALLDEFRPVAVLLVAVPNDAIPLHETFGAADLINVKPEDARPALRVIELARSVLGRAASDRATEAWYLSYYEGARAARWNAAKQALASMQGACRARDVPFGVAMFPLLYRLGDEPFAPIHRAYESACRDLGVPFLDLTAALAVEGDRALWVHPTDHHPDARAHELAAKALEPFVGELVK